MTDAQLNERLFISSGVIVWLIVGIILTSSMGQIGIIKAVISVIISPFGILILWPLNIGFVVVFVIATLIVQVILSALIVQ